MKLILKQYLSSLKERGELDALIPELLGQMGLDVFSKPSQGTRQYGVDVAAVGTYDGKEERVYLLSIKSGDLDRREWNSGTPQNLRPSLDEIIDVYIPTHLPVEHRTKPISICIVIGGHVKEEVRENVTQYEVAKQTDVIKFVEWDGDILAGWIEKYFMRENIFSGKTRSLLRKALALLDEPEVSFRHFRNLTKNILIEPQKNAKQVLRSIRQLNICLWILYTWARDEKNVESAYLASEYVLLNTWNYCKNYFSKRGKSALAVQSVFVEIFKLHTRITTFYCVHTILPYSKVYHGLSVAVNTRDKLDINLRLYDVLGRLGLLGLGIVWNVIGLGSGESEKKDYFQKEAEALADHIENVIQNNRSLYLPIKDDQSIDVSLAVLFLWLVGTKEKFLNEWLAETSSRVQFSYVTGQKYPCNLVDYLDLLEHPKQVDQYQKDVTQGSVLFPTLAFWAAMLKNSTMYEGLKEFQKKELEHCNFQYWFADETSEMYFYTNAGSHGVTLSDIDLSIPMEDFLEQIWNECLEGDGYHELSAEKYFMWPLLFIACRHYRLPPPLNMTIPSSYTENSAKTKSKSKT